MKKLLLSIAVVLMASGFAPVAEARVGFYVNAGCCYGGYYGGYPAYYAPYQPYYAPYYVAPPPVVYAVPPPAPVIYEAPAPIATEAPAPEFEPPVAANQTSPTFIDSAGRTC